jgi:hypothetical protein
VSDKIDIICERLIRLAVSTTGISTTSPDCSRFATLEAAVIALDPDTRAAVGEHLHSPGRYQRINDRAQMVQGTPATARRPNGRFSRAAIRMLAIEIVWRLTANKKLPSFLV